ncbi:MAG: alpha-glucan family phosphorylase [Firmicutes bacterium]|nr:alpha-glucan family phosphorylase [Bacillota bacterium]
MFSFRVISVTPKLPEAISRLRELAYNLWFSWDPRARELFRRINDRLYEEVGHNPVKFLMKVHEDDLEAASQDEEYISLYKSVFEKFDLYLNGPFWFSNRFPEHAGHTVAYFSAEFGLHESHPIYSGGLGLLAGDHCKSASDLGLPFVGVGLLYRQGYFTQKINREGWQEADYPELNFFELPMVKVVNPDGSQLTVQVEFPGRKVYLHVWKVAVGRVNIYLLDADHPRNSGDDRRLTAQLYGGDRDYRLAQEILLGIGGVRALRALDIAPYVWHINEGHAAFSIVERLRELVQAGVSLDAAREVVRATTIFTTHTAVPAGHDTFAPEKIDEYFSQFYWQMGADRDAFLELGLDREHNVFNMTLLAVRHSCRTNGVSRLHGKVTREMLKRFYPGLPVEEVPVTHITNGVHTYTWLAQEMKDLFFKYFALDRQDPLNERDTWAKVDLIPDDRLWSVHQLLKDRLIQYVRNCLKRQRLRNQEPAERVAEVDDYLHPDILTIGFARRFATYKRAYLLFRDPERLNRILNHPERPVRIIFAGKAHPADAQGRELIRYIHSFTERDEFRGRIILLENYDINMARRLLQGVDVWLNTPRRPLEASGTSGQKAGINGAVNVSTLDGWWPEAYNGRNGYAFGYERKYPDEESQDRDDAYSLYSVLEDEVAPAYYSREGGLPRRWIALMKESIKTIAPVYNTWRMVVEYALQLYLPAIRRGIYFSGDNYEVAGRVSRFKRFLEENWHQVAVRSVETNVRSEMNVGDRLEIKATVYLGPVWPKDVAVEAVYGDVEGQGLRNVATAPLLLDSEEGAGTFRFVGHLILPQGALGYTVRVRPKSPDFDQPFELPLVAWAPGS